MPCYTHIDTQPMERTMGLNLQQCSKQYIKLREIMKRQMHDRGFGRWDGGRTPPLPTACSDGRGGDL